MILSLHEWYSRSIYIRTGNCCKRFCKTSSSENKLVRAAAKNLSKALKDPMNAVGIGAMHFERHDLDMPRIQPQEVVRIYVQEHPNEWLHTHNGAEFLDQVVETTKPLNRKFDIVIFEYAGVIKAALA